MWNFEKIFHDNIGNSPKLKTPKMKDKVHRKKYQLGFFFPSTDVFRLSPSISQIPTPKPSSTSCKCSTFL